MNIYENYDGNDINDATFMVESFVEELQLREKLSPKLKALAAAGLIGLSSLGAASCSMPNDPTAYETPAEEETKTPADDETSDDTGTNDIDDDFGFDGIDGGTSADDDTNDNTADDTGNDLNPSDNDPDAGDEDGSGFDTDTPNELAEPKFVFSDEGYKFKPVAETVEYYKNSGEEGFKLDGAIIAVPTVDSKGNVIFCNMSDVLSKDSGLRIGDIDTKNPYIIFKDSQICSGKDECYILYDDLKSACDKAKVKMDKDLFFDLNFQLNNYSYAD